VGQSGNIFGQTGQCYALRRLGTEIEDGRTFEDLIIGWVEVFFWGGGSKLDSKK